METELITKISKSLKQKLNKNGCTNGTIRIELFTYRMTELPETQKPVPFVNKEGEILLHIIHY